MLPPLLPAVLPSPEGLAALEGQRQRVRAVKAQVNEIKVDRGFMKAAKALNKQARCRRLPLPAARCHQHPRSHLQPAPRALCRAHTAAVVAGGWWAAVPKLHLPAPLLLHACMLPPPGLPLPPACACTQAAKAATLLERAAVLRTEVEEQAGSSWRAFEDLLAILQEVEALSGPPQLQAAVAREDAGDDTASSASGSGGTSLGIVPSTGSSDSSVSSVSDEVNDGGGSAAAAPVGAGSGGQVAFTPLGLVAREVNCANELWMALVLTHDALQALPPPQLAGALSAGAGQGADAGQALAAHQLARCLLAAPAPASLPPAYQPPPCAAPGLVCPPCSDIGGVRVASHRVGRLFGHRGRDGGGGGGGGCAAAAGGAAGAARRGCPHLG